MAAKETEAAAKETTEKETEPLETEAKIPENAEEITHDEPEASDPGESFIFQNRQEHGAVENRDGRDPVTPVQKSVYKAKHQ